MTSDKEFGIEADAVEAGAAETEEAAAVAPDVAAAKADDAHETAEIADPVPAVVAAAPTAEPAVPAAAEPVADTTQTVDAPAPGAEAVLAAVAEETADPVPASVADETADPVPAAVAEETMEAPVAPPVETPTGDAPDEASVAGAQATTPDATGGSGDAEEPVVPPPPPIGDRPAITAPKDIGDIPDELTEDDFAAAVARTVFEFKEGDIVAGHVVRVDPDEVLVDIGYKSEGVIPSKELSIRNNASPSDVVTVGDEIEALVLQMEDENGRLVLSKKRAQYERAWGRIERVMNSGETVTGPVIEVVKGGLIVDIGLRGFLPASLVDLRRVRDLQPFVGQDIEAKVIELDKNRNNVVLSRRAYLEEAQAEQRHAFLDDLDTGDVRKGVVSSVVNFGAFVDLGGMDGLVHVSELSWQHVSHPGEIVSVGDEVQVKVLEVDRERERISLSIRQTREDPWEEFVRDTEVGAIIDGQVTKTVPFGAFVSVGEGVEGLVHVSEIAMHHVESPEMELSISQQVRVKVTEVDADRRRVSLSIKQALPEWEERSTWSETSKPDRPRRREFQREEEVVPEPSFNADASLEAILEELKERGIGRS